MPLSDKAVLLVAITALFSAALLSMCGTGCVTKRPDGGGGGTNWINVAALIARTATEMSVSADLVAHPDRRQAYTMAEGALTQLLAKDTLSATDLANIVAGLPLKKLQSSQGMLWAITLASVFDAASGIQLDISSAPAVRKVGEAIRDGLHAALYPTDKTRSISGVRTVPVKGRLEI